MRTLDTLSAGAWSDVIGLFTDIDDTLTTNGAITADALQALADLKAAGLVVVAVTGRPVGWSEPFVHTSILDTPFVCQIEATTEVAGRPAVIPRVSGRAWLTGVSYYGADPEDPFPEGYRLNDTWFAD